MLNHGIVLNAGRCCLRPMRDEDEENVIALWNQDYVVGNLYMTKTTQEIYRKHFEAYKCNPDEWRWVVEETEGKFVGTISLKRKESSIGQAGGFALYPTEQFLAVVPNILMLDFAFLKLGMQQVLFTIVTENNKIRKFHKLLHAINTGECSRRMGSNGKEVVLEHWYYDRHAWLAAADEHAALCS